MSMRSMIDPAAGTAHRRRLILVLVAVAAVFLAFPHAAARAQVPAVGSIVIDTAPLRAMGVREYATLLEDALERGLERRLGDRRARGGARLEVRLDRFFMAAYSGERDDFMPFGPSLAADTLEGEARLVSGGQVIARVPLTVSLPASHAGPWYLPDAEPRRAAALADAFADWVVRRL